MTGSAEPTIVYEEGEDGWIVASIPEVPGVFSQGRTRDEARANVLDALQLMTSSEPIEVRPYSTQDWQRDNAGRVYRDAAEMDEALDEYCGLPDVEST
jgi:predicted RNase H-like HicB family nuclease